VGNELNAKPPDVHEHNECQFKDLQQAYGEALLGLRVRRKLQ
jgi:hypothetical protein